MKKSRFLVTFILLLVVFTTMIPVSAHAVVVCGYREKNSARCTRNPVAGKNYCKAHLCKHGSCSNKIVSGSNFCSSHTCGNGKNGCYKEVRGANEKCYSCRNNTKKTSTYSSSSKKTNKSSKSSYSSKIKNSMPDCDDYEDYADFMDDWDGCMPDGSDAEAYWDNW